MLTKIAARDSVRESARFATVKGLDDKLDAARRTIARAPADYRTGTLSAIAEAYDAAGDPDKAAGARRLALHEGLLLPFARGSAAGQQRLIDSLPEGEVRSAAEAIQRHQAEAFAKDAFAAGTALYPGVGRPVPIDDLTGRITQARIIAAYRGIRVAPFTADEIAAMGRTLADGSLQEREAVLRRINALPDDMRAAIVPVRTMSDAVEEPRRDGDQIAQAGVENPAPNGDHSTDSQGRRGVAPLTEPSPDSRAYRNATRMLERLQAAEKGSTTEPLPGTPEHQAAAIEQRRLALDEMKGSTTEPPPGTPEHEAAAAQAIWMQADEAARSPEGSIFREPAPNDQSIEKAF